MGTRKVTIHEVAEQAGVSRQTVSRVINNRPDVARKTRQRVQEVIQRLGYQPSAIARSLSQQRSYTIGVVTSGLKYIGPSRTLNGITERAEEEGYGLLLKELKSLEETNIRSLLGWLQARQVDGIIWAVPEVGENRNWIKAVLPEIPIPLIFLTMESREDISIVSIDNYHGGRIAVEHLVDLGRKNIAHISGPLKWWESRKRKNAWEDVLSEANINFNENWWAEGNWGPESGERAMRNLLEQFPDMDAIFVGNDQMALGVIQVALREGIRIPEDLAIVGFDNLEESAFYNPSLTTVDQDQYDLGSTAVSQLVKSVDQFHNFGETDYMAEQKLIRPKLIIRDSSRV